MDEVQLIPDNCAVPHCPLPAALMHDNKGYCVADYRAPPGTILRPLGAPERKTA